MLIEDRECMRIDVKDMPLGRSAYLSAVVAWKGVRDDEIVASENGKGDLAQPCSSRE